MEEIKVTNDTVASILVRIWGEMSPADVYDRYKVLQPMVANPHPIYEIVFKETSKSKVDDLKDLGVDGLAKLQKQ